VTGTGNGLAFLQGTVNNSAITAAISLGFGDRRSRDQQFRLHLTDVSNGESHKVSRLHPTSHNSAPSRRTALMASLPKARRDQHHHQFRTLSATAPTASASDARRHERCDNSGSILATGTSGVGFHTTTGGTATINNSAPFQRRSAISAWAAAPQLTNTKTGTSLERRLSSPTATRP